MVREAVLTLNPAKTTISNGPTTISLPGGFKHQTTSINGIKAIDLITETISEVDALFKDDNIAPTVNSGKDVVFVLNGAQSVGNNVTNYVIAKNQGMIISVFAVAKTAPTGHELSYTIVKNGNKDVATVTIADGQTSGFATTLTNTDVEANDYFQINVTGIGSGVAGSDVVVSMLIN